MQSSGKLKGPGLIGGDEGRVVGGQLMVLSHQHGFSALRRDSREGGGARARRAARPLLEFNN